MHTLSTDHDGKSVPRSVGILDAPQNRKVVGIVGNKESGSQSVLTESNKSSTQWKLRRDPTEFAPLQPGYFGGRVGHPRGILPRLGFARFAVVGEVIRSGVL
jgi:hypothetical protein